MPRVKSSYSLLRDLQYAKLSELAESGKLLDIGGSQKSGYHELLGGKPTIITGNIDASFGCDVVFDAEKEFPFRDAEFSIVLAMNLIEHLYRPRNVFSESFRVLKFGGRLVIAVPFMFHIHGSPNDYHRYTASCLEAMCREAGFTKVEITELGHGLFSLIYQEVCGVIPTRLLKNIARWLAVGIDRTFLKLSAKYRNLAKKIPLGYFVVAYK